MNLDFLLEYNPVLLALYATLFTWAVTALGSGMVFFFKTINQKVLNSMLGFAAGVMIAASFWSLLQPAIEMTEESGGTPWIPAVVGFLSGGAFLLIVDKILPHLHMGLKTTQAEGIKTQWQRSVLLVMAITLHNIPEGLAVGVAFGALAHSPDAGTLAGAVVLAFGIGLQNFPEGAAVSIPLRREGLSRWKAFNYGQLSGIVEPISGVLGAYLVLSVTPLLPYALSFAAGAMIFVVVEELIPESQRGHETDYSTIGAMLGFAVMMTLDVALG
ncbi:MAG: ZIP family metal transporter [Dysgonamonadaceae bacterium]|jgi:ZIP family zinc transporter|nr:ZIP family metal transporter [Dysgonamonadaceae bacterium]MDD3355582.1 ZIP family metal transporter [Dysgonamonadaceae bacterium]MDD3728503.1 ZIP family metal transporter [Dysgonamonadaceae bacterium]MDD4245838.1 ZIP family metal transporter [Dysgonamonadaceae bacterium]MDD4606555.1 ZIP family metal transporter [Dysgonamonadaceae bacterium]